MGEDVTSETEADDRKVWREQSLSRYPARTDRLNMLTLCSLTTVSVRTDRARELTEKVYWTPKRVGMEVDVCR